MKKFIKFITNLIWKDPLSNERKIEILTNSIERCKVAKDEGMSVGLCYFIKKQLSKEEYKKFNPYDLKRTQKILKINFPNWRAYTMYQWPTTPEGYNARIAECEAAIERLKNVF